MEEMKFWRKKQHIAHLVTLREINTAACLTEEPFKLFNNKNLNYIVVMEILSVDLSVKIFS